MNTFPEQLRQLRMSRDLSQQVLATKAGLNSQQIVRYENGKSQPMLDAMIRLAKVLGCSLDELASGQGSAPASAWQQRVDSIGQLSGTAQKTIGQCVDALIQWHRSAS